MTSADKRTLVLVASAGLLETLLTRAESPRQHLQTQLILMKPKQDTAFNEHWAAFFSKHEFNVMVVWREDARFYIELISSTPVKDENKRWEKSLSEGHNGCFHKLQHSDILHTSVLHKQHSIGCGWLGWGGWWWWWWWVLKYDIHLMTQLMLAFYIRYRG